MSQDRDGDALRRVRPGSVNELSVGVFRTDAEGACVYINRRCEEITGSTLEQARDGGWLSALHPDDREAMADAWKATVFEGRPFKEECRFVRPGGEVHWVLGEVYAEQDASGTITGYLGTTTEITALKAAEDALRREKELTENIIESSVGVEDSGPGIPPELREKVLEPFFTTKEPTRGTGLGLALCYGIIQEHRGDIRVEESRRGGARFVFSIPRASAHVARRNRAMRLVGCLIVSSALMSTSVVHADVLVVDSTGTEDFTSIQAAVDAALDGDTILVRRPTLDDPSRFGGFAIVGKSLTVVGPEQGRLEARVGPIVVRGLAPDQTVVLSSLDMAVLRGPGPRPGLLLEDNAGPVRVRDCSVEGLRAANAEYTPPEPASAGCEVRSCEDVVIVGSSIVGGRGGGAFCEQGGEGAPAVLALDSTLALYDTSAVGGVGGNSGSFACVDPVGGVGGDGIRLEGSFLYASACSVRGGTGGYADYPWTQDSIGGAGGTGVRVDASSTAFALDSLVTGGDGGFGMTEQGDPGTPVVGTLGQVPGLAPRLSAPHRAAESSALELTLGGTPGDHGVLLVSRATGSRLLGTGTGILHTAPPLRRVDVGTLPASGELTYALELTSVPPGQASDWFLQAAFLTPGGAARLSALAHASVLDDEHVPHCGGRIHVDADAPPGGDGTSWATAYADLHDALLAAPDCVEPATEIWVAEGLYRPAPAGGDRERRFEVRSGVHLYGGFAGDEATLAEREPALHPTLLSGDLDGDDGPNFSRREDNAHTVVRIGGRDLPSRNVLLDGFEISHGAGYGCEAHGNGSFVRCSFLQNDGHYGAGLYFVGTELSVVNCQFRRNRAASRAAGLYCVGVSGESSASVEGCDFALNVAENAAAILIQGSIHDPMRARVSNCVVTANEGTGLGHESGVGGVRFNYAAVTVVNSILWGNEHEADTTQQGQIRSEGPLTVDHCCIEGLDGSLGGVGNIDLDPRLVSATSPLDLRLAPDSPCIDAGDNAGVAADVFDLDTDGDTTEPLPEDLGGLPRFVDDPATPDTGAGIPPIVDIGAHERP